MTYDGTTSDTITKTMKYGDTLDLSEFSVTYLSDFSGRNYVIQSGKGSISGSVFTVGAGTATIIVDPAYPKKCYCANGSTTAGTTCDIGIYTYAYKRKASTSGWTTITDNGWGIKVTDTNSTAPITEAACVYINDKPLVNTMLAFYKSKATSIDVSGWYTKNVNQTTYMFREAEALEIKGISDFDMTSVTNAGGTFASMPNIQVIDLTNWDTSHITNFNAMFRASTSLRTIYVGSSFVTNLSGQGGTNMFETCNNLVGGAGTTYNDDYVGISRAKIDGGAGNEGYFTQGPPSSS